MDFHGVGKVEAEGGWTDDLQDLEWSKELEVELVAGSIGSDVCPLEHDLVSYFEVRSILASSVGEFLLRVLGVSHR